MSITVNIHKSQRQFTTGLAEVEVNGKTVGDCLNNLVKRFPDIKNGLFDEKGNVLNVVEIYVNDESAYPDELLKPVSDGDEIYLTLKLAGG